jgi:acid phosphatase type 7
MQRNVAVSQRLSRRRFLTLASLTMTNSLLAACQLSRQSAAPIDSQPGVPTTPIHPTAVLIAPPTAAPIVTPRPTETSIAQAPEKIIARKPYIRSLTATSASISWHLKKPQASWLAFGAEGDPLRKLQLAKEKQFSVPLDKLQPGTRYQYQVGVGDLALTPRYTFRSSPPGIDTFSFAILGDSGQGRPEQGDLADRLVRLQPDFVLHTGDVVYGKPPNFDKRYFSIYADLVATTPVFPAIGDHDDRREDGQAFLDAFTLPANTPAGGTTRAYAFDYGTAHFIALDTESDFDETSPQYRWLADDLAATHQPWKFVYFHRPVYSSGEHGSRTDIRKTWCPLFERYGVAAVFCGHDHNYERTNPMREFENSGGQVVYVVTGGGGAELRPVGKSDFTAYSQSVNHVVSISVRGDTLAGQALQADGTAIDRFTIALSRDS